MFYCGLFLTLVGQVMALLARELGFVLTILAGAVVICGGYLIGRSGQVE